MHSLYVLRHAKSSWELAGELDYQRGLTERGQTDAKLIAGVIEERFIRPDLVICSGARRARETLEIVAQVLPPDTPVDYDDRLYQATAMKVATVVRAVDESVESLLLVGHNPSFHDFCVDVAGEGDELERLATKFPTAALAELKLGDAWSEIKSDSANLVGFTAPKQLRAGEHETL